VLTLGQADLGFALGHDLDHGDAVDELGFALNCSAMPSRSVSFAATMPLAPVREWAIVLAASFGSRHPLSKRLRAQPWCAFWPC
jgi:hypothetical protein